MLSLSYGEEATEVSSRVGWYCYDIDADFVGHL